MGARGPQRGQIITPLRGNQERQDLFIKELAATGSVIEAARRASPDSVAGARSSFESLMRDDPDFNARAQEALAEYRDSLVREAARRGRDGWDRPVFQRGTLVGTERQYSDALLLAELRKHYPEHYSQKMDVRHQHSVASGGSWSFSREDLAALSSEERDQLRGIINSIRAHRRETARLENRQPNVIDGDARVIEEDNQTV